MKLTTLSGSVDYKPEGNGDCPGDNGFAINKGSNGDEVLIEFFVSGTSTPIVLNQYALFMDDFDSNEAVSLDIAGLAGYAQNPNNNYVVTTNATSIDVDSNSNNNDEFLFYYTNISSFKLRFLSGNRNYCFSSDASGVDISTFTCIQNDPAATGTKDTDGDGVFDHLDNDSDGDGCFDSFEGGDTILAINIDTNGRLKGTVNTFGISNTVNQTNGQAIGSSTDANIVSCACPFPSGIDTDNDGLDNICDVDDDNDGILDQFECNETIDVAFNIQSGNTRTFNITSPDGFKLDISSIDNSFNLEINGTKLVPSEIQFSNRSGTISAGQSFLEFASDGNGYGESGIPGVWSLNYRNSNSSFLQKALFSLRLKKLYHIECIRK